MRAPRPAAGSPVTWALALGFLCLLDAAVTRTSLLWGKTDLWVRGGGLDRVYLWQTYEAAQKIYFARREAPVRVALLGNSRVWLPARDVLVEEALEQLAPTLDVRVDNLAVWGAKVGDLEVISRHLGRLQPTVVVLTLSATDLVPTSWAQLLNPTGELLEIGWAPGPLAPAPAPAQHVDRWLRTVWPLYRFRRFVGGAITERVVPVRTDTRFPDHFPSTRAYFDAVYGKEKGAQIEAAYDAWRAAPTLARFVTALKPRFGGFGLNERILDRSPLTAESPGPRVLDVLLARLAAGPWASFILLMPENPLLEADVRREYHDPEFAAQALRVVNDLSARHRMRVVDGRRWMPAEAFADLLHLFPELGGFHVMLAKEILNAIER